MLKTAKLADAYQVPTGGAWDTGRMMAIVKSLTPHTTKAYNWTAERARNAKRDGGRFAPSVAQVAVATVDGATLRAASQATEKKTTRQTKKGPQPSPIPSAGLSVSTPASQTMDIDGFGSTDPTVEDTPMTEVTPTPATQESPPDGASTTLSELLLILQGYLQNPPRMGERPLSTVPTWLVSLTLASEAVKAAPEYKVRYHKPPETFSSSETLPFSLSSGHSRSWGLRSTFQLRTRASLRKSKRSSRCRTRSCTPQNRSYLLRFFHRESDFSAKRAQGTSESRVS